MKKAILIIAILLGLSANIQLNAQNNLSITVKDIKNKKGSILISIFNSSDTFLKKGIASRKAEIKGETAKIEFSNLPAGEYAISLFQDENNNMKLDTGLFGIPKEKYGFSNNAKGVFGPPEFDECKFTIKKDTAISIEI